MINCCREGLPGEGGRLDPMCKLRLALRSTESQIEICEAGHVVSDTPRKFGLLSRILGEEYATMVVSEGVEVVSVLVESNVL